MDTKHCQRCHKLLRADARSCNRCGYVFSQAHVRQSASNGSHRSVTASMPSNPPASPHRAGHYSGLHPEDQPFQSSFMPVQRPAITRRLEQEPEEALLPAATARSTALPLTPLPEPEQSVPEQLPKRQVATPSPLPLPLPQRSVVGSQTALPVQLPQGQFAVPALPGEPPVPEQVTTAPLKALPRKSPLHKHLVPVLLLASLIFFLLATSVLAFQLINRRPLVPVHPASNNASTAATPQQAPSTSTKLQLSAPRIDFGAALPGTISRKPFTLTSAGSGQIEWRAGTDSPWLTITPRSGTFSGRETVALAVNRGILAPQSYTGHVTFFQQGNNNTPLTLTVTMKVSPTLGNLSLAPTSLSFNGSTKQDPSSQELIVQNMGGQALDWTASVGTSTGGNWLSVSDVSGHLLANSQQTLTASAISTGLSVGLYQGSLTFSYAGGHSLEVLVTLTISPPTVPGMGVSSNLLKFGAIQGIDPQPQSFTVTNTGNGPLHWAITEDANGAAFVPVSPPRGTVPPGKSVTITVRPHIARATAGVINARITISDTDKGTPVQSQQVAVAITISSQAVISVSDSRLTFNHSSAASNSTQLLVITNTGSAQLNWTLSQSLPAWLSVDIPSGTLPSGASTFVNVTCDSSGLPAGNYTYTLVVSDTDPGTRVAAQNVQVILTVT
jgi:Viral BACON domain